MQTLYIFGNGFDIAHGIRTPYAAFREFLKENHESFLTTFESMYNIQPLDDTEPWYTKEAQERWDKSVINDLWWSFEEKIGHPDVEGMYDSAYSMVDTMPMEGIIDTMNVYWREQYGFVDKLQKYVLEWLQTIDTSQAMCKKDSLINNRNDLFMSFNYTDTCSFPLLSLMLKQICLRAANSSWMMQDRLEGFLMEYKPHDYQQFAINYILEHPIVAMILGMGLGKTSITLTAIEQLIYDSFEVSKVLVVAPLRVARNTWSDEIHKWNHLKHLRYSIVLGSAAERKKALEADADIYIINRENLQWLIEQSGVNFFWDMVVLDELSSFKNWNCKRFKAFMKVQTNVKRVIGLTGTPSSNGLMDLFAEFKCLDMRERLGRFISQYRVNYFVPDRMNGPIVYSYKLRNGAEEQIYEKISDITISMKALDHLQMPELISNEYPVYMNDEEAKLYADMEEDLFIPLKKGEITATNAAALSGKLLQMANGAVYSDDGDEIVIHDQKLDALEDMIEAANGRSVMVAYWFKHDLSRIMRRLTEKKIPFEKLDSEESIRKWNRGSCRWR